MSEKRSQVIHNFFQSVFAALTVLIAFFTYNNSEGITKLTNIDSTLVAQNILMKIELDSFSKQLSIQNSQLLSFQLIADKMKTVANQSIEQSKSLQSQSSSALLQNKILGVQTRELSTQTKEISAQTDIFNRTLDVQRDATAPIRSPRFEYVTHTYNDSLAGIGNCAMKLINKGSSAIDIFPGEIFNPIGQPNLNYYNRDCPADSVYQFVIEITNIGQQEGPQFDFFIEFESVYGRHFKQRITYAEGNGKISIGPPIEFLPK